MTACNIHKLDANGYTDVEPEPDVPSDVLRMKSCSPRLSAVMKTIQDVAGKEEELWTGWHKISKRLGPNNVGEPKHYAGHVDEEDATCKDGHTVRSAGESSASETARPGTPGRQQSGCTAGVILHMFRAQDCELDVRGFTLQIQKFSYSIACKYGSSPVHAFE